MFQILRGRPLLPVREQDPVRVRLRGAAGVCQHGVQPSQSGAPEAPDEPITCESHLPYEINSNSIARPRWSILYERIVILTLVKQGEINRKQPQGTKRRSGERCIFALASAIITHCKMHNRRH